MTNPDPTPALLSAERLAEIRANDMRALDLIIASNGIPWPDIMASMDDRRALLAHLAALTPRAPVDGEALGRLLRVAEYGIDESLLSPFDSIAEEPREGYKRGALALHAIGYAAGRSEGEALRHQAYAQVDAYAIERDKEQGLRVEAEGTIAHLEGEIATIAARARLTEDAQAQLDRALASCETYRAEIERLTSSLRTETTIKEQVQDELVAMRLKRREEWERAERLAVELAEAQATVRELEERLIDYNASWSVMSSWLDCREGDDAQRPGERPGVHARRMVEATRLSGAREEREAIRADVLDRRASTDDDGRWHAFDYVVRMLDARGEGGGR